MPSPARPIRDANERLWAALRLGKAGQRFRRRVALGPLVADFYCPALKLVVEIDASGDRRAELAAEARDQWLWRHGYAVLRLDRAEVMQRRDRALAMIADAAKGMAD
jgi:very-short-patch-repair endonuclease